jgi:hypothetical protein
MYPFTRFLRRLLMSEVEKKVELDNVGSVQFSETVSTFVGWEDGLFTV